MTSIYFLSALTLGFLGSFHCAVMCGPIALMLPVENLSKRKVITSRLIYNTGRIITYILLGLLFGLLGLAASVRGLQNELSIAAGVLILSGLIINSINKNWLQNKTGYLISNRIRKNLKKLFAKRNYSSMLLIGMLNGLLPCGFVYLAIAGALASGSALGGITYMFFFGLGTFPLMMLISVMTKYLGKKFNRSFSKFALPVALALGVLLIYRGSVMTENKCSVHSSTEHTISCAVPK